MAKTESAPLPRIEGISPQFLVDDLQQAVAHYRDVLGFEVDFIYESFYASVSRDFQSRKANITRNLTDRPWRARDFYVEDVDGYILCFSESTA